MFVDGKVVMIVGAGPGLGATLACAVREDGADLVLISSAQNYSRRPVSILCTSRTRAAHRL